MTDRELNKDLFMKMASIPSTFNQCIVTMNVTEGNLMVINFTVVFVFQSPRSQSAYITKGVARGGSGVPVTTPFASLF